MIKSSKAAGIVPGAIAPTKPIADAPVQVNFTSLSSKTRKSFDLLNDDKKQPLDEFSDRFDPAGETDLTTEEAPLVELAQASAGGAVGDAISPYPTADIDFGNERLHSLFSPGFLGVNPLFAAVGIGAIVVKDNTTVSSMSASTVEPQPIVSNVSGVVIDGYIAGATVFVDTDGDGELDENEVFTMTDEQGKYTLEVPLGFEGVIRAVGGTNINSDGSTGAPNTATLSAPLVSGQDKLITLNITPITSLVEALAQSDGGLSVSEASARLANALGLNGVNLLTFDSIAAEGQSEDLALKSQALAINKVAAQVVSLINSVSTALQPDLAIRSAVDSAVAKSVMQQVVTKIVNSESDGIASLSSVLDSDALNLVVQKAVVTVLKGIGVNGDTLVRDTASVIAAAQGSASAQVAAIDRATSAASIAAEQVAIFNNKAPIGSIAQTVSVAENSKDVGVFTATDPDSGDVLAYSLAGSDALFFEVDKQTGAVSFKIAPDFEQLEDRSYRFTVLATDKSGASSTQQVTVNVTDVNEASVEEALKAQIAQLKTDIDKTTAELEKAQLDAQAKQKLLEADLDTAKKKVDALTAAGISKDANIDQLKTDIDKAKAELDKAQLDAQAKQKLLEADIDAAKKKIEALSAAGTTKDADIAQLKSDIDKAKAELDKAQLDAEAKQKLLEADIDTAKKKIEALTAEGNSKDADIAQLKTDIDKAKAELDKAKLEAESKQKSIEADLDASKKQIEALVASGKIKDADIAQLKSDIDKAKAELDKAQLDAEAKQKSLEADIDTAKKKIEALTAEGVSKDADIAQLKTDIDKAKAELDKAKLEAETKQKSLEADLDAGKKQIEALLATVASKDADIAQLKSDIDKAQLEAETKQKSLEADIDAAKKKIEALTASGTAKDADISALKTQIEELEAKSAQTAKEAEAKLLEQGNRIEALEASGKAKESEIAELKAQLATAKDTAESAVKSLDKQIVILKDDVSDLKAELAARDADVAVLKKIIEELGSQLDKVILGTTGNDTITNKAGESFVYALSGNDVIVYNGLGELFDGGMVDSIDGGAGVDTLQLIEANRTIEIGESWAKASGIEILKVTGTQDNVNGFQAYLSDSAFSAGIRTIDLREIVALKDASLASVVDGSKASSQQGLTILGTSGNDFFTGGAGQDSLTGYDGADVYRGGGQNDSIDLGEVFSSRDRVVFESSGEANGVDLVKGFQTGLASEQADMLDFSAFSGSSSVSTVDSLMVVMTENPAETQAVFAEGSSVNVIRLLDIQGGQDITTAEGLQAALRSGGEYSNIDIEPNTQSIVVTSGSLDSGDSFVFMLTGGESGLEIAQLVAVLESVSLNALRADNFGV